MRTRNFSFLILSGLLAIGLAACRQEASQVAANPTPAAGAAATAATPASTQPAEVSPVTADPVVANQRNAARRRERRPGSSAARPASGGPTAERNTGYSEERRGLPTAAREHEVPSGTILRVAFDKTISTATAKTGDTVPGELLDDLLADDGTVVAPSGSRVVGQVERAVASGRLGGRAELAFRLIELSPSRGRAVPISTSIYQRSGESHTKHDVEYIAGGAAVGALIGQVLGRDTESTLKGAAVGAAAGTGVAAATGALDFEIQAGRTVAFTLQQPLRLPTR